MKLIDSKRKDFHAIQSYIKRIQWVKIKDISNFNLNKKWTLLIHMYMHFQNLVISLAMEANSFSYMAKSNPQGDQFWSKLKF